MKVLKKLFFHTGGAVISVIRAKECSQISDHPGKTCVKCMDTRALLLKRNRPGPALLHPKAPMSKLKNKNLLVDEVANLRRHQKELEQKIADESVNVSTDVHEDLLQFYKTKLVKEQMSPFVRLFWEEQEKAFTQKNKGKA